MTTSTTTECLWTRTYLRTPLDERPAVCVLSALNEVPGLHTAPVSYLQISHDARGIGTRIDIDLDARQMRALAALLTRHADRIDTELLPLLEAENATRKAA